MLARVLNCQEILRGPGTGLLKGVCGLRRLASIPEAPFSEASLFIFGILPYECELKLDGRAEKRHSELMPASSSMIPAAVHALAPGR